MTLQKLNGPPPPRALDTTSTSKPTQTAANAAATPAPVSPRAETPKTPSGPPASYHQDQLGKARASSPAPAGHTVFQSKQDVAAMNARRGSVFGTRAAAQNAVSTTARTLEPEAAPSTPAVQKQPAAKFQKLASAHGAQITAWSNQAEDPIIRASSEKEGVCSVMVNEWARAGHAGPSAQAAFGQRLTQGDTQSLVDMQRASRQKHEQFVKHDDFLNNDPAAQQYLQPHVNELKAANNKHNQNFDIPGFKPEHMLFPEHQPIKSNEQLANTVSSALSGAKDFVPEGQSLFAKMMISDKKQGGHAIGIKVDHLPGGKLEYSLLDPNTGEFSKIAENKFAGFLTDHMNTTYGKDYVGGGVMLQGLEKT